jgi:hypothetical protein
MSEEGDATWGLGSLLKAVGVYAVLEICKTAVYIRKERRKDTGQRFFGGLGW